MPTFLGSHFSKILPGWRSSFNFNFHRTFSASFLRYRLIPPLILVFPANSFLYIAKFSINLWTQSNSTKLYQQNDRLTTLVLRKPKISHITCHFTSLECIYTFNLFFSQLQTNTHSSTTTTTTRVSKSSSSSTSRERLVTSDLKADNMRNDLVDFKNNLSDMKNSLPNNLIHMKRSLENLVDDDDSPSNSPIIKFPDDTSPIASELSSPTGVVDTLKFEQKTMNNFKKTTVSTRITFLLHFKLALECTKPALGVT